MTRNSEPRLARKRVSRDEHGKTHTPEEMLGRDVVAERRRLIEHRNKWQNSVLPTIPPDVLPGFHLFWASTTNQQDSVHHRLGQGYSYVKSEELPEGFTLNTRMESGKMEGCISVNEMVLMKIPMEIYQADCQVMFHDDPLDMQRDIVDRMRGIADAAGTPYGTATEGGEIDSLEELGRRKKIPNFEG